MKNKKTYLIIENFRGSEKLKSEILNWSFGFGLYSTNNSAQKPGPTDLKVTRFSDKNYAFLMDSMLKPRFFPKIMLVEENNSGSGDVSRTLFSLSNVLIADYQQSRGWDAGKLTETIVFLFDAYSMT